MERNFAAQPHSPDYRGEGVSPVAGHRHCAIPAELNRQFLPLAPLARSRFRFLTQIRKNHRSAAVQLTYAASVVRHHPLLSLARPADCISRCTRHVRKDN